jgi:hypothetical protein
MVMPSPSGAAMNPWGAIAKWGGECGQEFLTELEMVTLFARHLGNDIDRCARGPAGRWGRTRLRGMRLRSTTGRRAIGLLRAGRQVSTLGCDRRRRPQPAMPSGTFPYRVRWERISEPPVRTGTIEPSPTTNPVPAGHYVAVAGRIGKRFVSPPRNRWGTRPG